MQAVECAQNGKGHTFPNPAVGCVLVRQPPSNNDDDDNDAQQPIVIGRGFHPRSGYPHAEVFALFQAAGHVPDGVVAAQSIVDLTTTTATASTDQASSSSHSVVSTVNNLLETYGTDNGAETLFANTLQQQQDNEEEQGAVTAYVTLEPCCHYGKTPPCAKTLALAGVHRVVVGFRDPNPKVDGGGVQLLQETAGVTVDLAEPGSKVHEACSQLVTNFCKRITPNALSDDYSWMTGSMRMALRSLSNKKKRGGDGTLTEISWGGPRIEMTEETVEQLEDLVEELPLSPEWMEHLDAALWQDEMILLRLTSAVKKKKGAKLLGTRIANILKATVAQTVGHCVLLYRPGSPPVMDLEQMVKAYKKQQDEKDLAKEERRKEWERQQEQQQQDQG